MRRKEGAAKLHTTDGPSYTPRMVRRYTTDDKEREIFKIAGKATLHDGQSGVQRRTVRRATPDGPSFTMNVWQVQRSTPTASLGAVPNTRRTVRCIHDGRTVVHCKCAVSPNGYISRCGLYIPPWSASIVCLDTPELTQVLLHSFLCSKHPWLTTTH